MLIRDIQKNILDMWSDLKYSWRDEMSKKYKIAIIDEIDGILNSMSKESNQLHWAVEDAIHKLEQIPESEIQKNDRL